LHAEVVVAPVHLSYADVSEERAHHEALHDHGVNTLEIGDVEQLPRPPRNRWELLRRIAFPRAQDYYPVSEARRCLERVVRDEGFDRLVAYSWQALALRPDVRRVLEVASIVDPIGAGLELRREQVHQLRGRARLHEHLSLASLSKMEEHGIRCPQHVGLVIEHAYHHAELLEKIGTDNVVYPHPLPTPSARGIRKPPKPADAPIENLVLGSLKGASSRFGFEFLLEDVQLRLQRQATEVRTRFRVWIVGHGELLPSLRERLKAHRAVEVFGFVPEVTRKYHRSGVLLVTISCRHGFPTCIAGAFGNGMCVVAHGANRAEMPEMVYRENAPTGEDPEEFTTRLIHEFSSPGLRARLAGNARSTSDAEYSYEVATQKVGQLASEAVA
jgi:glycosyltransferase involved in cell wall biosynthesis